MVNLDVRARPDRILPSLLNKELIAIDPDARAAQCALSVYKKRMAQVLQNLIAVAGYAICIRTAKTMRQSLAVSGPKQAGLRGKWALHEGVQPGRKDHALGREQGFAWPRPIWPCLFWTELP